MAFPENEDETIALYKLIQNRIGWHIVELCSNSFPDAILESDEGERLNCEFEYLSGNYKKHGHPIDDRCDLIICWHDDWSDCPLPVMTLKGCADEEATIIRKVLGFRIPVSDLWPLRDRIAELEKQLTESKRRESERAAELELNNDGQAKPEDSAGIARSFLPFSFLPKDKSSDFDWVAAFAFVGLGIGLVSIFPVIARMLS